MSNSAWCAARYASRSRSLGSARQGIFAEELGLLANPVADDGIVPIETQGETFPIEHLVAHVGVDCRAAARPRGRSSAVARAELCGDRGIRSAVITISDAIGRRRRDEAIGEEDRRSEQRKVQERLPEQTADHGVYQIGDVNARSCVVIGTFGSHLDLEVRRVVRRPARRRNLEHARVVERARPTDRNPDPSTP